MGGSRLLGRLLGGDELDKATGGGATRLRRLWEAFSKDLVPGNRQEPGLGGVGEPRAGTTTGWDTPTDAADQHQPTRLRMLAPVGRGLEFSPLGKCWSPYRPT